MAALPCCTAQRGEFRGWSACYLSNGLVRLVAVPDIGGRLMAYDLGPYPFLFVNPSLAGKLFSAVENLGDGTLGAWKNYGGDKTWPAPQGWHTAEQWPGPPDPVLDTGRYTLDELREGEDRAVVAMTSPPDPRTGVQITRQATLHRGSSRVALALTFANVLSRPIRWSIWDVVQLRAERVLPSGALTYEPACAVTAPLNPQSCFPKGFKVMAGDEDNPQWQTNPAADLFVGRYLGYIGKVGIDSTAGWVACHHSAAGYAFAERFDVVPGAEYPDGGASVECWTVGRGQVANLSYDGSDIYLMETEVLGPLCRIEPGESRSLSIEWGACRCPGLVVRVSEGGCISQVLRASRAGDYVHLTGQFGVFDVGTLALVWMDRDGHDLETIALGPATPLAVNVLDRVEKASAAAAGVELRVRADVDGRTRLLAGADLEASPAELLRTSCSTDNGCDRGRHRPA